MREILDGKIRKGNMHRNFGKKPFVLKTFGRHILADISNYDLAFG
jgi:hypothetical protein